MPLDQYKIRLLKIKDSIVEVFNAGSWIELGMLTESEKMISNHPRLLRSLSFGDDDYEACALETLRSIVREDPKNLDTIEHYVALNWPELATNVSSEVTAAKTIVFSPTVFSVPDCGVDRKLVSVMMPFEEAFSPVYQEIEVAAADSSLRADNIWNNSVVIQDIFALIYESFIVVCDFTGRNPNVFYEAGIAHTLGKHVVPITQSADDIPFDLRHHRYLKYLNNSEGRSLLRAKLGERLATLAS
jgi:hypothetical protein